MEKFQTVRGMQDFLPERAEKKQWIEDICRKVFESYGFQPLETPIVEDFGLLSAKGSGGEAIKEEIYYFKDKSERELGLRFDLTVPLARVVAANPQLPKPFKRYQIGTVYRYDRPGERRYREFTQADWDIVGSDSMLADFETIAVAVDAMQALGFKKGEFAVKINNRKLLEEIALCCSVEKDRIVDCFRSIDKLEKIGKQGVEKELQQKGIKTQILGQLEGGSLEKLKLQNTAPLQEMKELLKLLKENDLENFVSLDLSLARGLEYYTGMVFEVCVKGSPSVGGGGRYDNLIELYGGAKTPAVGCSFGVERLLEALEKKLQPKSRTKLFIAPVGEKCVEKCLQIAAKIRQSGVSCEMDLMNRGIGKNIQYADKKGIAFVAIIGEDELKEKSITVKNLKSGKQKKIKISELKKLKNLIEQ
jgi:histidyl-tRNA synthetase